MITDLYFFRVIYSYPSKLFFLSRRFQFVAGNNYDYFLQT